MLPKRFDQARPFATLSIILLAWLFLSLVVKTFTRRATWANLPRTMDAKLLAAIPQMKPWVADSEKKLWALREAGKQVLIYGDSGAELDLSGEAGSFMLRFIDQRSGSVSDQSQIVQAGGKIKLPGGVVWLTKE